MDAKSLSVRNQLWEDRQTLARKVRQDSLKMIQWAGSGNPGSCLSSVEILIWLYFFQLKVRADDPLWEERDRFILSKGQASPALYSVFSLLGWVDEQEFLGFRQAGTRLQTHPEFGSIPGIDFGTGSLAMGLSAANGIALGRRHLGQGKSSVFVLCGDGELQEGQIWEAMNSAIRHELGEVSLIVDANRFQGDGEVPATESISALMKKAEAFGWSVAVCDGHDFASLEEGYRSQREGMPHLLIAQTIKGKGVSFMEADNAWHVGGPKFDGAALERALSELGG